MDLTDEAIARLATVEDVDLNDATQATLFTCPIGKKAYITKVVVRDMSIALDTVEISFGWNTGVATDVIANAGALTVAQWAYHIPAILASAVRGNASETFEIDVAVAEGDAAVGDIDVFGYLVDV